MPRYALLVAYDGGDFAGWWRQPGRRTVAAVIDEAFARMGEQAVAVQGVARTDSGVHARGQVAQVDCARDWAPGDLLHSLNGQLSEDCVCTAVAPVAADWDLHQQAVAKTYRYRMDVGPLRNPFLARTSWRPPQAEAVTIDDLNSVAAQIIGSHDFSAFARRGDYRESYRCTIHAMHWQRSGPECWCVIEGDRFAYRLVRSLVACCWAVARGSIPLHDLTAALVGTSNDCSRQQAPAKGLCLDAITLREQPPWLRDAGGYQAPLSPLSPLPPSSSSRSTG